MLSLAFFWFLVAVVLAVMLAISSLSNHRLKKGLLSHQDGGLLVPLRLSDSPALVKRHQMAARDLLETAVWAAAPDDRRHEQAAGRHPAPCASSCEANAFEVEIRQLRRENEGLRAVLLSAALVDVASERKRQIEVEGWSDAHDDGHDLGELAAAASSYALAAADEQHPLSGGDGRFEDCPPGLWPWSNEWWKPGDPRRMLVKSGALVLAAIEQIDRHAQQAKEVV